MKKIIFILFAVVSWQHAVAQTFTYNGLNYNVTSATTVEVANQNGAATGTIAIPTQVTNSDASYNVTRIGNFAFSVCYGLTSITIPDSVTSIGQNAFEFCNGLTSLIIPNSVTSIESYAFSNCSYLESLTIPSSVTNISDGVFINCLGLTSVTIPDSVTSIGSSAFSSCISLTSVTIPISVTSIGYRAFYGCTTLTSVIIPSFVTSIGENTFESCTGITTATIPISVTSIGAFAFRFCTSLTSLTCNVVSPLSINLNVFEGVNQGNCSLTVPGGSVAAYFAGAVWQDFATINNCTSLTENTTTITAVGCYTWSNTGQTYTQSSTYSGTTTNCVKEVLNLTITTPPINFTAGGINYVISSPNTVAVGSNNAVSGSIIIPATVNTSCGTYTVTSISASAFQACSGLTQVTIPESITIIGALAFRDCTSLTSVIIPNSVISINPAAFYGCTGLTSATISNTLTSIGSQLFYNCSGLTSVIIPSSVTNISNGAFRGCIGLTSLIIPSSVSTIGNGAFRSCINLTSVTIPSSVTSMGIDVFYDCVNLTSVVCNIVSPLVINANVFQNVNLSACSLTVPAGSVVAYQAAAVWKDFSPITCSNSTENITTITACSSYTWSYNNQTYTESGTYTGTISNCVTEVLNLTIVIPPTNFIVDGLTYVVTSPITVAVGDNSGISGSIVIPDSVTTDCGTFAVTSISDYAFVSNQGITSVIIPNSITSIGNDSFGNCRNITSVTIPNSVTSIGTGAFGRTSLTAITIPNSITIIEDFAFAYTNITSIIIPNSVTRIDPFGFGFCTNLTSVTIPHSVTSIGESAFNGCSSLTFVICNIETPLSIEPNVFDGVNQSACSLTVPDSSVAAYYATAVWKNFNPINNCFGLTENPTTISVCDSYTWANTGQTYTTSGTYRGTTTNCVTEVLILTINTPSIPSLSLLDQHCNSVSGYLGLKNQSQTFTAGASGNLDKISLYLGNPNGDASESNLTVQVYEGSGTTETLLESQTYTYPAQWGFQNIDFNFSTIAVVQGQVYTFKLSTPSVSHGFVGIDTDNTYAGGSLDFAPSSDLIFKTYVNRFNQTFCQGATVANLNVDGTNTNWYNTVTGGNQLSSTTLLETGTYFASQTGNSCESERAAVNVLVNPTTTFTSQPVANFICSTVGSTATFSVESNAVSPTYTWQYRVATTANSNPEWITITTANSAVYANFNTATLTVTKTATLPATGTQYRVLVSGTCGDAISNIAPITILSTTKAGTITSAASVCIGNNITLTLGSYSGSSFQWQSAASATGVFTDIPGANGTTYTIVGASLNIDKSYRVVVSNSCNSSSVTSTIKTLTVNPNSVAGIVTGGGIVCSGSTGTLKVTGYVGSIQWQSSADGIDFVNVSGIAATYTASNITADTYFRAKITSGLCSEVYSNAVQFTIGTVASSGTLTAADATVCKGTGTTLTLIGSVGSIKWLKSTNWTADAPTWTAVTTSISGTLATGNLSVSTAYKAEVTIGACSIETSQVVPVLVYVAPLAKTITANVTSPTGTTALLAICNSSSILKTLTIGAGYNGIIQWQKSTTSTTTGFVDIQDATGISYTISDPTVGVNYFRAKFTNTCGVFVFGTAFTVYYKDCTVAKTMVPSDIKNSEFKVMAYPNPYTENFTLNLTTSSEEKVTVSIFDMIGKIIDKYEVLPSELTKLVLGVDYSSAIYNIVLSQGQNTKTLRVIKQ